MDLRRFVLKTLFRFCGKDILMGVNRGKKRVSEIEFLGKMSKPLNSWTVPEVERPSDKFLGFSARWDSGAEQ